MARSQQAKFNFSAGVLSPRLSLRADTQLFESALTTCDNFIITPHGSAIFREGLKYINASSDNRIFQWHQGGNESDILVEVVLGGTYRFWQDDVELTQGTIEPHSYTNLADIYFTNSEITGIIVHEAFPPLYFTLEDDGSISAKFLPADAIPLADYRDAKSPAASMTIGDTYTAEFVDGTATQWLPSRKWTFKYDGITVSDGLGNAFEFEYSATASAMINRLNTAMSLIPALNGPGTFYSVVSAAATIYDITITGPNAGKPMEINPHNVNADRYVSITTTLEAGATLETAWSYPTYVFQTPNYYQCLIPHNAEMGTNDPPNATYWLDLGTTKPATFDYQYPTGNIWTDLTIYYPGNRGFPSVAVIHQQRMILMANLSFSMGIFGSRINSYLDFERGPEDDDPFFFALDSSDTPVIKWAESAQSVLMLGTSSGDYKVTAQVTLSPSDIQAFKQNNARSEHTRPVTINTSIIYVEQGAEKIRLTTFLEGPGAWTSSDISRQAEHLLHIKIKRVILLQTPEPLVIALRDDGSLVGAAYRKVGGDYRDLDAFSWFEITSDGYIYDIAGYYSLPDREDILYVTISYDGGATFRTEKMPYPTRTMTARINPSDPSLTDQNVILLDSWIKGVVGANNEITGLAHLEGQVVAALVDDAWAGTYTVFGGEIVLDDANISGSEPYTGNFAVGVLYKGTLLTYEMASGNQAGVGFFTKRRWNRLFVRTLDSAIPTVNGVLPPDRTPASIMDIPETLRMGLRDNEIRGVGWGDGSILIEQDRPYPTHIVGCAGEFSVNNS